MNQIVIGALLPYLIGTVFYLRRGLRASFALLVWVPLCMAAGALWAVVPDLPRMVGMDGLYHRLARDPRMNIFFFHTTIDRLETDSIAYTAVFVAMLISLLAVAWREIHRAERLP